MNPWIRPIWPRPALGRLLLCALPVAAAVLAGSPQPAGAAQAQPVQAPQKIGAAEALVRGKEAESRGDDKEAMRWFRIAADQGNAEAALRLGGEYFMKQQFTQAVMWERKAAELGLPAGQRTLATAYRTGTGVKKDDRLAFQWYLKAAEQGDAPAEFEVAVAYATGAGVTRDPVQAQSWMKKSAEAGNVDAKRYLAGAPVFQPMATEMPGKPGQAAFVLSQKLAAVDGATLTVSNVVFFTDAGMAVCDHGKKLASLADFHDEIGKIVTVYLDYDRFNAQGQTYAYRVEDGGLQIAFTGTGISMVQKKCD